MSGYPYSILRIVTSVLQCLGILLTFFRLWHRFSIRRFWWEDAWAAIASVCGIACLVSYWVQLKTSHSKPQVSVIAYWVYSFAFACAVWAVRMSILYSITRLLSPTKTNHCISIGVTVLFASLWGGIVGWKAYHCGSNLNWYSVSSHSCSMPRSNDIYELATDIISDAILVILPLHMLWNIKLPKNEQRRMILCIFSASIGVSFTSIFRAIYRLSRHSSQAVTASNFEVAICLIVCNLLVTITYFYRLVRKSEEDSSDDSDNHTTTDPVTAPYLTTVDLEHLGEYATNSNSDVSKQSQVTDLFHRNTESILPVAHSRNEASLIVTSQ
ncbi:hypothetical protein BJ138DRAFT_742414 [Hygrophoropsis aurantiaca]|uniref:Uncharacterized protein n=1 Tax=Hygrophoropsis aurantiaca TaxID=72124 RepID=A0ACB7ZWV5_9AGAM|nr:hypothetical protein BJ138DRAFT_742414 [Hygrophoropsis aurantiaca]